MSDQGVMQVADVDAVATAEAAAELVERAFGLHRLSAGADCGREDLLVGDWCMVSAAEMIAGIQRPDVEATFALAATTASVGGDFKPVLRQAVATVAETPPPRARAERVSEAAGGISDSELIRLLERRLSGILAEDPDLVSAPMRGLVEAGGKRLRPILVLLCSSLGPRHDLERAATVGCVFELIHAAALVHDDIVDESPVRRGQPSVPNQYGVPAAVRVGDYYFGRAAGLLAALGSPATTQIAIDAVVKVCLAQLEEYRSRGLAGVDEDRYLGTIEGKTAALFSGACAAGAAEGGADRATVSTMGAFGRELGVAFQIVDDVIDFLPTSGKPLSQDLRQAVSSLPLIYALRQPATAARLRELQDSGDDSAKAATIVRESGALDDAMAQARTYRDRALQRLSGVRDAEVKARLVAIAERAVERKS